MMKNLIFLIIWSFISTSKTYNILVFSPAFAASHMNFMAHLADTLTEAGHNVTFLVPIADEARKGQLGVHTTKDVVIVERDEIMKKETVQVDDSMEAFWHIDITPENAEILYDWFCKTQKLSCANLLRRNDIIEEMRQRNFDVAIAEPLTSCGLALFEKLGIKKTILTSSCAYFDFIPPNVGESLEYSYVPVMSGRYGDKMSLVERVENMRVGEAVRRLVERMLEEETNIYREKLGNDLPHWKDLFASASLVFVNSNPYIDFPRPVIQKTIPIGGISVDIKKLRSQKVNEEWDKVLSLRNKTILVSFGTMVKSSQMPPKIRDAMFKAMQSLPDVTFIWKYESDDVEWAKEANNIVFSHWVPQSALLADDRLTAFLTHGGLGSVNELSVLGKPSIVIPIFCDQNRNAAMLARHDTVLNVPKSDLEKWGKIRDAFKEILSNEKYFKNSKRMAEMIESQPFSPKELVVKHTEFLARFGPFPNMDPYGRNLTFIQRNFLDYYGLIILASVISIFVVFVIFRFFIRLVILKINEKKEKEL